jgi:hypothetical protein
MDVRLAELKVLYDELLHGAHPKEVEGCKEPAAPASVLVGYRPSIEFGAAGVVHVLQVLSAQTQAEDVLSADRILGHTGRRVGTKCLSIGIDLGGRDVVRHVHS